MLLCPGLCFQQCHSNSGVCSDFTEFLRNVGHMGGREREWKEDFFFLVPSKLYAFSITSQKYYCKTVIWVARVSLLHGLFFSGHLNLWMYFTDNIISTGKGSVRSEIIQQPETLTAICVCVCQSVWWFYAFLIFSLALFERHTDKELTMSARRESAR